MDFKDQIRLISERIPVIKDKLLTEEATKTSLIMPFIAALGYDVFNPTEVVPEMACDIGKKKNEKIDYAIMDGEEPMMLIECKHWAQNLDLHETQLLRYFTVSKAKFGVLANGLIYRFYTDIEEPNKMDEKPFLEVNLQNYNESQVEELKKFHKTYFNIENVLSTANDLKYMRELKSELAAEFSEPSADLVRLISKRIYNGTFTAQKLEQFTAYLKRAIKSYLNELVESRLKTAMNVEEDATATNVLSTNSSVVSGESTDGEDESKSNRDDRIVTTEEEIEGFHIVKSLVRTVFPSERVIYRDTISYFGILADDNNRRPICRLHFNGKQKYIGVFDAEKKETRYPLDNLDEIYQFEEQLKETALRYL